MKSWNSLSVFVTVAMSRLAISHPVLTEQFLVHSPSLVKNPDTYRATGFASPEARSTVEEGLSGNPSLTESTVETSLQEWSLQRQKRVSGKDEEDLSTRLYSSKFSFPQDPKDAQKMNLLANKVIAELNRLAEVEKDWASKAVKAVANFLKDVEGSPKNWEQNFPNKELKMIEWRLITEGKNDNKYHEYDVENSDVIVNLREKLLSHDTAREKYTIEYVVKPEGKDKKLAEIYVRFYIAKENEKKAFGLVFYVGKDSKLQKIRSERLFYPKRKSF